MRRLLPVLLLALLAPPAEARRDRFDELMQVLTPVHKGVASGHPHVNIIVLFGRTSKEGVAADLSTFQATLNGDDITSLFTALEPGEFGVESGLRAVVQPQAFKLDARNLLKLSVRSNPFPKNKRTRTGRDKERLRFTVEEAANQPPVALATADTDIVFPGLPVEFDGRGSTDPDLDPLTFTWDFGDGQNGGGSLTAHTYGTVTNDLTARLTLSDGSANAEATIPLEGEPDLDAGRTKGLLQVSASGPLEFGGVAGGSAQRAITIANPDATETSQLKVRLQVKGAGFTLDPATLDLGPNDSAPVTVTFAPTAEGHAHAKIAVVASASNRSAVSTMAHGYGGTAPAGSSGPTMADRTAFYAKLDVARRGLAVYGLHPDGTRFFADNSVYTCVVPGGGTGTGDACITDEDCATNQGYCPHASTCRSGPNAGQPCTTHADCPNSGCPSYLLLDPEDMCSGVDGSYVILSEEGSFSEPNFNAETERAATLMRLTLNGDGEVTDRRILTRANEETYNIACDGLQPSDGGRVFMAEYFNVDTLQCFRTEREALKFVRKLDGRWQVPLGLSQLDSIQGLDDCFDIEDASAGLAASSDGDTLYAAFDVGGVWRVRPSPLAFLTNVPNGEALDVHPDGALLYARAADVGTEGRLSLYKLSAGRVSTGPLPLGSLTPCASLTVPNNGGTTFVQGVAAARSSTNPDDALILVSFSTSSGEAAGVLGPELGVRGIAAFVAPTGAADSCGSIGVIALESVEQLTF